MIQAFRGEILHFLDDPAKVGEQQSYQYFADGILVVENGHVVNCGDIVYSKMFYSFQQFLMWL